MCGIFVGIYLPIFFPGSTLKKHICLNMYHRQHLIFNYYAFIFNYYAFIFINNQVGDNRYMLMVVIALLLSQNGYNTFPSR